MSAELNSELLTLVSAAQRQDSNMGFDARDEIVRRTNVLLSRYLFSRTRTFRHVPSVDDIQDIMQDAYFDAFRSLNTFKPELATFQSWLCSIALRQSFKWLKKADKHAGAYSLDDQPEEDEIVYAEPESPGHLQIEQRLVLKELLGFIAEAIEAISNEEYRLVVGMLFTGWFSLGDVRDILNWNENTLKSAFRRGFSEVRERISLRNGESYAEMAEALISTYKKSNLAKGMSVLDTQVFSRISNVNMRTVLKSRLLDGFSETDTAYSLCVSENETKKLLYDGVLELVRLVPKY